MSLPKLKASRRIKSLLLRSRLNLGESVLDEPTTTTHDLSHTKTRLGDVWTEFEAAHYDLVYVMCEQDTENGELLALIDQFVLSEDEFLILSQKLSKAIERRNEVVSCSCTPINVSEATNTKEEEEEVMATVDLDTSSCIKSVGLDQDVLCEEDSVVNGLDDNKKVELVDDGGQMDHMIDNANINESIEEVYTPFDYNSPTEEEIVASGVSSSKNG